MFINQNFDRNNIVTTDLFIFFNTNIGCSLKKKKCIY